MKLYQSINRFWTRSIRRQLMLGIAVVHAVLMTIFVFDLVERQRTFLSEQTIEQTRSLSETLAANSISWVLADDVIGLEEVISAQEGYPGLEYAMVLSPDGKVLGHTESSYVGRYITDDTSKSLLDAVPQTQLLQTSITLVDVAAPIIVNDFHIGWARVGISGDSIASGLLVITRDGVIYTIMAILVGSVFAYFMAKGMTSGLNQLVSVAAGIREGMRKRAMLHRADEIGQLARDFNEMLDALDRNIASRQMMEQEVRSQRDHLEIQVKERTREFELARDEALRATAAKSEFLANMSHELRTPLNSILGFTSIIKSGKAGPVNEEQADQLQRVYENGQHLLDMINDILDLAKIESGKIETTIEEFDLAEMLRGLQQSFANEIHEHGLEFNGSGYENEIRVTSDRDKLWHVVQNIITNAIKYTHYGSIDMLVRQHDDKIEIAVSDTGVGIKQERLSDIFKAFEQANNASSREYTGVGLGLAICREYLGLLRGHISVSSEYGKGSTFTVCLPVDFRDDKGCNVS